MNKEERRKYNKQEKRNQREGFDQSLASSSSIKKDLGMTHSHLLTKYLHKNINQHEAKQPRKRPLNEKAMTLNTIKRWKL